MFEKRCNQIAKQCLAMGRVAVEMAEFVRTAHHGCCVFFVELRRVDGLRVLFFEVEDSPCWTVCVCGREGRIGSIATGCRNPSRISGLDDEEDVLCGPEGLKSGT